MNWGLTWIIGGGPSAGSLQRDRLQGGTVLAVNDSVFHVQADAWFSLDHNYAREPLRRLQDWAGDKHVCVLPRAWHEETYHRPGITCWHRLYEDTPSFRPGCLASGSPGVPGCSGVVALNLAAQMGAKRIVLFGYDFHLPYSYFFSGVDPSRDDVPGILGYLERLAPWYAAHGIEILNANPESGLHAFHKISHEEAYSLAESEVAA